MAQVFSYQLNNGVPIKAWHGDMADRELPLLLPFLEGLAAAPGDLRPLIGGHFPLHRRALRTPVSFTMSPSQGGCMHRECHPLQP